MSLALVLLAVFVGASAQRVTGMGFARVAAPLLILVIGGFAGVLVVNVCGALTSAVILTRVWREVYWARWRVLVAGALIGILPGAWLVSVAIFFDQAALGPRGLSPVRAGLGWRPGRLRCRRRCG